MLIINTDLAQIRQNENLLDSMWNISVLYSAMLEQKTIMEFLFLKFSEYLCKYCDFFSLFFTESQQTEIMTTQKEKNPHVLSPEYMKCLFFKLYFSSYFDETIILLIEQNKSICHRLYSVSFYIMLVLSYGIFKLILQVILLLLLLTVRN